MIAMEAIGAVALILAGPDTTTQIACKSAAYTSQIGIPSLSCRDPSFTFNFRPLLGKSQHWSVTAKQPPPPR
ncbi:hypothetical protein PR003_g8825 [Phytophthora rubi]|uniref:Uncharacterized protein n=1 Tax=Phytophthora rubi TaxID=129364 RepID=A0A6A4FHX8_9STRA|nr:hypothetical protein PR001_g20398 [Phytophthora rubi]KAE9343717.1 hypothetical protein PR003_g8825 [Phytophthora rubi]